MATGRILIIEKGCEKYSREQMQSAGIATYIIDSSQPDYEKQVYDIKHVKGRTKAMNCYIIGSTEFKTKVKNDIRLRCGGWGLKTTFKTEDDVMKKENARFPSSNPDAVQKEKPKSKLQKALDEFLGGPFEEDDIAGLLLAVGAVKRLKIYPPTPENQYDALVKMTATYVQDDEKAKSLVDYYLEKQYANTC